MAENWRVYSNGEAVEGDEGDGNLGNIGDEGDGILGKRKGV
ncbi:hypothetical protein Tco_1052365, partial [Tanacetum coccineum]